MIFQFSVFLSSRPAPSLGNVEYILISCAKRLVGPAATQTLVRRCWSLPAPARARACTAGAEEWPKARKIARATGGKQRVTTGPAAPDRPTDRLEPFLPPAAICGRAIGPGPVAALPSFPFGRCPLSGRLKMGLLLLPTGTAFLHLGFVYAQGSNAKNRPPAYYETFRLRGRNRPQAVDREHRGRPPLYLYFTFGSKVLCPVRSPPHATMTATERAAAASLLGSLKLSDFW